MPTINPKEKNAHAFIRSWGSDFKSNASLLGGYGLYILDLDTAEVLDPGFYEFTIPVEAKIYDSWTPDAFFELRIFNGSWQNKIFDVRDTCHRERGYKFEYQSKGETRRPIVDISFRAEIKSYTPLQVQWLYHRENEIAASPVLTLAMGKLTTSKDETFALWKHRYTEGLGIAVRIKDSFAHIASATHYSNHTNFPCGGREIYTINETTSTDEIVQNQVTRLGKDKICILDLGTANGELLTHLYTQFQLNWSQLLGITAQDYRKFNDNPPPDEAYLCYNIEELYQLRNNLPPFTLILSDVTWLYLEDPIGSLEIAYQLLAVEGEMYIAIDKELATCPFLHDESEQSLISPSLVELLNSTKRCQAMLMEDTTVKQSSHQDSIWLRIKKNSPNSLELAHYIRYSAPSKKENTNEPSSLLLSIAKKTKNTQALAAKINNPRFTQYRFFTPTVQTSCPMDFKRPEFESSLIKPQ